MLYGLLLTVFIITSVLLIVIILLQQGKGGLGLGTISSSAQMIFGGSGGQDVFQKTTWILGALFMGGSLVLALMKAKNLQESGIISRKQMASQAPVTPQPTPQEVPGNNVPTPSE
jgi:preprotein translocase subunit SecG